MGYSACWPFNKHHERIRKFREKKIDKAYFSQDATYPDSKDLAKRTVLDKVLKEKAYKIAKNPKYDEY